MDIHFDWQACDSRLKICVSPARWRDFALQGSKKTLEIYDFQSSESYQGDIHSSSFFLFSTLAVPERLWQRRSHSLQQGSAVTPCPAVGPSVPFFVHVLFFIFVGHRRRSPFYSIHLLSTSNNGSIGSIPQTTSKMISLSLSKDILFVVDLGQLEPFVGIIFDTTDSMCNVCIFRNVKEVLVRTLMHPPPPTPPDDHTTACATCWKKHKSYTPISASLIFEICNPSKGAVSAACQKQVSFSDQWIM